jgi:hypothetical protein
LMGGVLTGMLEDRGEDVHGWDGLAGVRKREESSRSA